ncbi:MAG: hypothetical protein ABS76_04770 [Pelagibacterium sp. SCN 64-44]|nr:MAG: hypothetical protein ABS76_04770 [Pelagibacterium sp. SCN 64-44]
MRWQDAPEIAALFYRVFRKGQTPPPEFVEYLRAVFLASPQYDETHASFFYRDGEGVVAAALLVIPMQVRCGERVSTGRLASNFMADPARPSRGAARLVMGLRPRNQEFCFSDSCNAASADHWRALGCEVLPLQSLDWRRVFRPGQWLVARFASRLPPWLAPLLRALDALLRRLVPGLGAAGPAAGQPMPLDAFIAEAPALLDRFTLRPVWGEAELRWLLAMAALNTIDGPLQCRQLRDGAGALLACTLFYARRGAVARVLNCLARPGAEAAMLDDLFAHLDAQGCAGVRGMAQPFLMPALWAQRFIGFVPRGAYGFSTRHSDIVEAIHRGDAYLGGLMGEDWSRLLRDFLD